MTTSNHETVIVTYRRHGIAALDGASVALTDGCHCGTRRGHRDGRGGRRQRSRRGCAPPLGVFGVGGGGRKDSEGRDTDEQGTVEHLGRELWWTVRGLDSAWGMRAEDSVAFCRPLLYVRDASNSPLNPDAVVLIHVSF